MKTMRGNGSVENEVKRVLIGNVQDGKKKERNLKGKIKFAH